MVNVYIPSESDKYINVGYFSKTLNMWYILGVGAATNEDITHWVAIPELPKFQIN